MVTVDLRIDELVLHGFEPSRRATIEAAFRTELERLVTQRASAARSFAAADAPLQVADLRVPSNAPDAVVGRRLAEATMRAIDGSGRTVPSRMSSGGSVPR